MFCVYHGRTKGEGCGDVNMYVLVLLFYFGQPFGNFFGKETVLLAFRLYCFNYGAVALSASFFPFGVLDRR